MFSFEKLNLQIIAYAFFLFAYTIHEMPRLKGNITKNNFFFLMRNEFFLFFVFIQLKRFYFVYWE